MRFVHSLLLALAGILIFGFAWHLVVLATRPAPLRLPAMAFSDIAEGKSHAVILDSKSREISRAIFDWDEKSRGHNEDTLKTWLKAHQPKLAGLPTNIPAPAATSPASKPSYPAHSLPALLDAAKVAFGGGLIAEASQAPGSGFDQARARAESTQIKNARSEDWIPPPHEALSALYELTVSGEMPRHIIASLFRVAAGFIFGALLGIPLGLAMGSFAWLSSLLNSVIQCLRPISPIAWLPVAALTLKGADNAAVFIIFLSSFFPIAVSTAAAVATVDLKYRRSALNFGVRGLDSARYVIVPAVLPSILTSLRIALGISWVVVVAAEMLGVSAGLGYLVNDARNQLRFDRVVAAMIVIGLIGLLIDTSIRRFERMELERRGLGAR